MKTRLLFALLFTTSFLFAQGIEFEHTPWKEALELAKNQGKALFVDSYATWCGPCKRMAKNVFTQDEVGEFYNENFINLKLDMEKKDGISFGHKYPVSAFPTLYFLSGDGVVVHKEKGGKSAEKLIEMGKTVLRKHDTSGQYAEEYEKGNRDYDLMLNYVSALNKAGKPSLKISNDYLRSQPDITKDQRLMFVFEAAVESDSKLFGEVIENKDKIKKIAGEEAFTKKVTMATNATVDKAIEYETESLLTEAVEAYKAAVGKDKVAILKMQRNYQKNTGNKDEYFELSKKQYKEVKNDEKELGILFKELSEYQNKEKYQDLVLKSAKQLVKLNDNDINIINYSKLLVKTDQADEAVKIVGKKLEQLEKNGEKSKTLERFKKYLDIENS